MRKSAHSNVETDPTAEGMPEETTEQTPDPTADPTSTGKASPSTGTAVVLLALHALLSVFWAVLAGKPSRDWLDLPFIVIMGFNFAIINPMITIATLVAYGLQAIETLATEKRAALSRSALVLQIIVFLALAVLWPFRFKLPQDLRESDTFEWYPLVGWACVNNALIALGQSIVLYAVHGTTSDGEQLRRRETQPLLAS